VRILGLDELDGDELRESVPRADLEIKSPSVTKDVVPEPGTIIAVVVLSAAALKGVAMWLLKKRYKRSVRLRYERRDADGSHELFSAEIDVSESASEADVIRQIGDSFRVDPSTLAQALTGAAGAP
jgi:hypothetical protein